MSSITNVITRDWRQPNQEEKMCKETSVDLDIADGICTQSEKGFTGRSLESNS